MAGCRAPDPVDAIVAISGGDTTARANQAITMFNNGWTNTIIFSGAAEDKTGPSNAEAMKQLALSAGIPEGAIYLDENSETTKQNAENVQVILNKINAKKIILTTSGYHQHRASLEFKKFAKGITVLNHPVQSDKDWSFWWWITPSGWWLAGSELVKIALFYVVGA